MLNVDDALGKLETVMALEDWQKCRECTGYESKPCYVASKIPREYKGGQYE
jgi:hypothetical protein